MQRVSEESIERDIHSFIESMKHFLQLFLHFSYKIQYFYDVYIPVTKLWTRKRDVKALPTSFTQELYITFIKCLRVNCQLLFNRKN